MFIAQAGGLQKGKCVLNVSTLGSGGNVFINRLKESFYSQPGFALPAILNANGYPTTTPPSQFSVGFQLPSTYTGTYIVRWTGQAGEAASTAGMSFNVGDGGNIVSPSGDYLANNAGGLFLSGTNGEVEFSVVDPTGGATLAFLPDATISGVPCGDISNITSVELFRSDYESLLDAGEIFDPDYIAICFRQLNSGTLRFLAWNNINGSNRALHAYDTPVDYISYSGPQYAPDLWGGTASYDNTGGIDRYTITTPPVYGGLVTGTTVQFFAANSNATTTPELKVGSGAAKVIVNKKLIPLSAFGPEIVADGLYTAVYDAEREEWIIDPIGGLIGSVPLDVQIALCNKTRTHGWFNIPHLYTNASVAAFTTQIKNGIDGDYGIEYSNEMGTTGAGFEQTDWAQAKGAERGFPSTYPFPMMDYVALKNRILMEVVTNAAAGDTRLRRKMMHLVFLGIGDLEDQKLLGENLTLDGSGDYTAGAPVTNYSTLGNRPVDFIDDIGVAMYFRGANVAVTDLTYASNYIVFEAAKTISAISKDATAEVTTSGNHGFSNGDRIILGLGQQNSTTGAAITGMTEFNNVYATVTVTATNKFTLSACVADVTGATVSANSTGYGTFTAGACQRIVPGVNADLIAAANDYATGNQATAIQWMLDDTMDGERLDSTGTPVQGDGTIDRILNAGGLISLPEMSALAGTLGLKVTYYEGAYDGVHMGEVTALKLGLSETTRTRINALIDAFKRGDQFRDMVYDFYTDFCAVEHVENSSWLSEVGYSYVNSESSEWALFETDLYGPKWKSYEAMQMHNADGGG